MSIMAAHNNCIETRDCLRQRTSADDRSIVRRPRDDIPTDILRVARREPTVLHVSVRQDLVNQRLRRPTVGYLDEDVARSVSIEVKPPEYLSFLTFDVQRRQIDLVRAELIQARRQRSCLDIARVRVDPSKAPRFCPEPRGPLALVATYRSGTEYLPR